MGTVHFWTGTVHFWTGTVHFWTGTVHVHGAHCGCTVHICGSA